MGFPWWCKSFGVLCRLRCLRNACTPLRRIWKAWLMARWICLQFPSWHPWAQGGPMLSIAGETCSHGCPSPSSQRCITCFCLCTTRSLPGFPSRFLFSSPYTVPCNLSSLSSYVWQAGLWQEGWLQAFLEFCEELWALQVTLLNAVFRKDILYRPSRFLSFGWHVLKTYFLEALFVWGHGITGCTILPNSSPSHF